MNAGYWRRHSPRLAAISAAFTVALSACGDDPFAFRWSDAPDTVRIYSLARPELNLPSAFNFFDGSAYSVEAPFATGLWDAALDTDTLMGQLVLLPPGALGVQGRARIAALSNTTYADVEQAPGDTLLYEGDDPVPVVAGTIYVVRTNVRPGSFGASCSYYAKMEPLVIDVAEGSLTFRYITSPICNSRDLVPPR